MTQPFDPTGMSSNMPGYQPSQAQLRYMSMLKLVHEEFKGQDQYIVMTPAVGPQAIKILTCEHAAQVVYDKHGRLATSEEIEKVKLENETARHTVQKQIDRQDLAKSVRRVLKD